MPFPTTLQTVQVLGTFESYPDGSPATGSVKFTSSQWLFGPTDDVIMPPFDAVAVLDSLGEINVELPATDDPQWNPQGWSYSVTLSVNGKKKVYTLELPYDGDLTVNLADVLQAGTVTPGESYLLLATRGAPGGVASLDGDGKLPVSQIPSGLAVAWTSVTGKPTFATVATTGDYVDLLNKPTIPTLPSQVGLGNVDNTSDANKPVSTATQTALNLKANLAGPTFTGTVSGITSTMVGLGSVNNTADSAKPVSTAQQTALNLKADLVSPTFTGTPTLPTGTIGTTQTAGNNTTALATTAFVTTADNLKAALVSPTFTGVPAAPTATPGTNTTQLATTAFAAAIAALKADLASPALTGTPTAPTAAPGTNTTQLATTAFTKAADDLINFTALTAYDQSQIVSRAMILPTDHGLGGWTFPTDSIQAGTILATAGLSYVVRLKAMGAAVNNIILHFTAGGTGLTAGQCFASLHNDAGAILGSSAVTADQATNWATGGLKSMPLVVAQGVTPGNWYKIRFWFNGTTGPTLSRAVNSSSAITNAGLSAPNFRYGTADTGLTTSALAPGTIGTITGGATAWWVAVS